MNKLLFVCSMARLRSPTAAEVLAGEGHETRFAGLAPDAERPLTQADLFWADEIFCFEAWHHDQLRESIEEVCPGKPLACMYIPDVHDRMAPGLVSAIEHFFRMRRWESEYR